MAMLPSAPTQSPLLLPAPTIMASYHALVAILQVLHTMRRWDVDLEAILRWPHQDSYVGVAALPWLNYLWHRHNPLSYYPPQL